MGKVKARGGGGQSQRGEGQRQHRRQHSAREWAVDVDLSEKHRHTDVVTAQLNGSQEGDPGAPPQNEEGRGGPPSHVPPL